MRSSLSVKQNTSEMDLSAARVPGPRATATNLTGSLGIVPIILGDTAIRALQEQYPASRRCLASYQPMP